MRRLTGTTNSRTGIILATCVAAMTISCGFPAVLEGQQNDVRFGNALNGLRQLGKSVAKAVLDRDAPALLRYDRVDLRRDDELSLNDKSSDLYCFLFDTSCIRGRIGRSVYEKLSTAQELGIKVVSGGKSSPDGNLYAIILFYDRSTISERSLRSRKFLCKESLNRIASWSFKFVKGKWEPVTPLFDNETDTLCSPD